MKVDISSECVRCGACRAVCPTFSVIRREYASARGKVSLCEAYREGEIDLSEGFVRAVKECLTCAACRENCPNGVDVPSLILAAREEIFRKKGLPFSQSLLNRVLSSTTLASLGMRVSSLFGGLLFERSSHFDGIRSRLPIPFLKGRLIPSLSGRSFIDSVRPEVKGRRRVGLFVGCLINYVNKRVGEATVKALEMAGFDVIVPKDQVCCGMPALGMGDRERARDLAIKNIEAFSGSSLEAIVTPCATCATALKIHFEELLKGEGGRIGEMVQDFTSRAREATEFLAKELRRDWDLKDTTVTYHDPCHMSRYQHIKDEPRELIERAGYRFVEMSHPCRCCGLGGVFSVEYYGLSKEIGKEKAEDIVETGADLVATACPGCILQIRDALHHLGVKKEVVHVVELLFK